MNKPAEETYIELRNGLLSPLIFYFPYDRIPEALKKIIIEKPILKTAFNKFLYFDNYFNLHIKINPTLNLNLTAKPESLDYLIIRLLELKDNSSPALFNFIFNKYYSMANGLEIVSDWMFVHFNTYFENENTNKVGLFEIQANAFKKHVLQLNTQIKNNQSEIIQESNLHTFFKNEFQSIQLKTPPPDSTTTKSNPAQTDSPKKKSDKHITAEEARNYLLKTVFNVKIE